MKQNVKKRQFSDDVQTGPEKGKTRFPLYWLGLLCFSSFWMFALGVWVGRGTAPVEIDIKELQKELAGISDKIRKKEETKMETYADHIKNVDVKSELEVDFYEKLKEIEADTGSEDSERMPGETVQEEIPMKKSLARTTKAQSSAKPDVNLPEPGKSFAAALSEPMEPFAPSMPSGPAEPLPPVSPDEPAGELSGDIKFHWTIQVSSLKDPGAAEKMVQNLKRKGYSAYSVKAVTPPEAIWYRVRVGPYRDKKLADNQITRLKQDGYTAILISM